MSFEVDDKSPPGSWKSEMQAAPWGYGQSQLKKVEDALTSLRMRGLWSEASIISMEIKTLRDELEALRNSDRGQDV